MQKYLNFINKRYLVFSLLLITIVTITSNSQWSGLLNNKLSDQLINYQAPSLKTDTEIHIINIDDYSTSRLSPKLGKFPWPRVVYAELLESLESTKLNAIVFDILFSEPDVRMPMSDAAFNDAIENSGKVFLAAIERNPKIGSSQLNQLPQTAGITASPTAKEDATAGLTLPWAIKSKNWKIGAINFYPDNDGVSRRYKIYRNLNGWHFPTLPSRLAIDQGYSLPSDNEFIMQWRGNKNRPYSECSFYDVYIALVEGNPEKQINDDIPVHCHDEQSILQWLQSGIVIIGNTSTGIDDFQKTPIANFYPGIYILATAIDNLKNNNALYLIDDLIQNLLLIIPIIFLCLLLFNQKLTFQKQLVYGLIFATLVDSSYLFLSHFLLVNNYLLPIAYTLISIPFALISLIIYRGLEEHFNRQKTIAVFSRFMDPTIVRELLEKGEIKSTIENKSIEITVLFSDIRGFTTLSEKHNAETIVNLLNNYFSSQANAIFRHKGTLDKFIGDAVMAFWGAPIDCPDQAEKAITAALEMEIELETFKQQMGDIANDFDIGIGIHTGMAVVGMIGSEKRYDYTCIGDTVNLASRIEGATKGVSRILVSETTKRQCSNKFNFISKGSFTVKGKEKPVELYAPVRKN